MWRINLRSYPHYQYIATHLKPKLLSKKLMMGMIGGGPGAFIGAVHRMAANLDGQIELVCGAFSSDAKKSKTTGYLYQYQMGCYLPGIFSFAYMANLYSKK